MSEKLGKIEKEKDLEKFEEQKKQTQWTNAQEKIKYLILKFSEILKNDPIVIYTKYGDYEPKRTKEFNKVKEVRTDKSGTEGSISVYFDNNDYLSVDKNGFKPSACFSSNNITKNSFHNILNMMDELIKDSGYTEVEKNKMFQSVVDGLKNKIIDEKSLEQVEK